MPEGANFWGILGSTNASGPRSASVKSDLNTSILRFGPSSAAYRSGCPPLFAIARPVYVAPTDDLSAARFATLAPVAVIPPAAGFHPVVLPSSDAQMKTELGEA